MITPSNHTVGASEAHPGQSFLPPPTGIREVAAAAGVSTATVSRALRGLPNVAQSTRERILSVAANLGYVASAAASELARGRGALRAPITEQLTQVASTTAAWSLARPFDLAVHPPVPSRGTIHVINGPLANPDKQDHRRARTRAEIEQLVQSAAMAHGFTARIESCNLASIVDSVRASAASAVGIVISTGGLGHSLAELHNALASLCIPAVEILINNDYTRKEKIPTSACTVMISGAGIYGYKLAIDYLSTAV